MHFLMQGQVTFTYNKAVMQAWKFTCRSASYSSSSGDTQAIRCSFAFAEAGHPDRQRGGRAHHPS